MTETPAPLAQLNLQATNWTVSHYLPRAAQGLSNDGEMYDFDAPYQRGAVWTVDQKRNLIRSIYMGLPIGNVILALDSEYHAGPYVRVVDGKQRILAVREFFNGDFTVPAWWFSYSDIEAPRHGVVTLAGLSDRGRRGLENGKMPALEFDSRFEYPAERGDVPEDQPYPRRRRSDEERLKAEAELYLLINFGGVDQTAADKARAAGVAGRRVEEPFGIESGSAIDQGLGVSGLVSLDHDHESR